MGTFATFLDDCDILDVLRFKYFYFHEGPICHVIGAIMRQVSFTGHRSQVTGYRSQVTIKTLSKFRDVTITEIPERFIDVSMQQTLTKSVLLYNFNEKISRGGIYTKWVEI